MYMKSLEYRKKLLLISKILSLQPQTTANIQIERVYTQPMHRQYQAISNTETTVTHD